MSGAPFDAVVSHYAVGRPDYPAALLDALGPLDGLLVLEGGCGTGIASRALADRGAQVLAFDVRRDMVRHTRDNSPAVWAAVVADGSRLPFRDGCADLICFAQAWHWLDIGTRVDEAARVLAQGGRWSGWWSHARADGQTLCTEGVVTGGSRDR